ncbi:MAG: hypothetical protein ACM3MK_12230 [Chitinophagales bacterium]
MKKKTTALLALLIILAVIMTGCQFPQIDKPKASKKTVSLTRVEITFEGGHTLKGYVRGLKLGDDSVVYTGGNTSTNLYDARGNVVGVFNYSRVLYIKAIE